MITLQDFCFNDTKNARHNLAKPWVFGGWRYATDARVCVREPAPGEPDETCHRPMARIMYDVKFSKANCTQELPPFSGIIHHCRCLGCEVRQCERHGQCGLDIACRGLADLAGRTFDGEYWHKIYQLGGVRYDPTTKKKDQPLALVADGGREILWMPVVKE